MKATGREKHFRLSVPALAALILAAWGGRAPAQTTRPAADKAAARLRQISDVYEDYTATAAAPLPVHPDSIAVRVAGAPQRFAKVVGGRAGSVPLSAAEKAAAVRFLHAQLIRALSDHLSIRPTAPWEVLVVCGEGGGMAVGSGGLVTAELFLLNNHAKTVAFYTKEPTGKGAEVNDARTPRT